MNEKIRRILVVCSGNTARSPAGEYLGKYYAKKYNVDLKFDSCGFFNAFSYMQPESREYLSSKGIDHSDFSPKTINKKLLQELQEAYKQLHLMKKIIGMGEECDTEEKNSDHEIREKEPFVAGSMLPFYYTEKLENVNSPILSDLERISALKERGFLSEEEFNLCKSKLFRNMKH